MAKPGTPGTRPDLNPHTVPAARSLPSRSRARLITGCLALLAAPRTAGILFEAALIRQDQEILTMPSRLIQTAEGIWCLDCTGEGEPTVILESGLGESGLSWTGIQPALCRSIRVCSYDRAGYGWSDPGAGSRDAATEATELRSLLVAADVRGPYIMVSHSLGNFISRLYTAQYPDEVAGLVLVDPTNEASSLQAGEPAVPALISRGHGLVSRLGLLRPFISGSSPGSLPARWVGFLLRPRPKTRPSSTEPAHSKPPHRSCPHRWPAPSRSARNSSLTATCPR